MRNRPFIVRHATFPDRATAEALGGVWRPGSGGKRENRLWRHRDAEALELLAFVLATPALSERFHAISAALAVRKTHADAPGRPPLAAREHFAKQARRQFFKTLAEDAATAYLAAHPDAPANFRDMPRYLAIAFKRQAVREHYRQTYGNPDFREA